VKHNPILNCAFDAETNSNNEMKTVSEMIVRMVSRLKSRRRRQGRKSEVGKPKTNAPGLAAFLFCFSPVDLVQNFLREWRRGMTLRALLLEASPHGFVLIEAARNLLGIN